MTKARTNSIADQAAEAFNSTVDKLHNLVELSRAHNPGSISIASNSALNNLPVKPGSDIQLS